MLVFDTSVFINGWRVHYPPDTFPSVWEVISDAMKEGRIVAPREVYVELEDKDDQVFAWAKKRRTQFVDPNDVVQAEVGPITKMMPKPGVRDRADPFVIAEAKVRGFTVVTYEGTNTLTGQRTKAADKKMPGICKKLGVDAASCLRGSSCSARRSDGWGRLQAPTPRRRPDRVERLSEGLEPRTSTAARTASVGLPQAKPDTREDDRPSTRQRPLLPDIRRLRRRLQGSDSVVLIIGALRHARIATLIGVEFVSVRDPPPNGFAGRRAAWGAHGGRLSRRRLSERRRGAPPTAARRSFRQQ